MLNNKQCSEMIFWEKGTIWCEFHIESSFLPANNFQTTSQRSGSQRERALDEGNRDLSLGLLTWSEYVDEVHKMRGSDRGVILKVNVGVLLNLGLNTTQCLQVVVFARPPENKYHEAVWAEQRFQILPHCGEFWPTKEESSH